MALSFLSAKALRVEVTEGVDLESGVFLTGEQITVGTAPGDDLRLGAGDVVGEHLTFIRQPGGKGWEYFTSDRGRTTVDRGNPRTGKLRPGMWFSLGNDTRVDILRVPAPENLEESGDAEDKKEIPLAIALPIMGAMLVGVVLFMSSLGSDKGSSGASLRTAGWFVGAVPMKPALDACLTTGVEQSHAIGAVRVALTAPDANFRDYVLTEPDDPTRAAEVSAKLEIQIKKIIAEAHLLAHENRYSDASDTLRRLENVLPVGTGKCPILSAARTDLATLELRGKRR